MASLVHGLTRKTDDSSKPALSKYPGLWEKHCGRPALLLPLAGTLLSWKSLFCLCVRMCACVCNTPQWSGIDYRELQPSLLLSSVHLTSLSHPRNHRGQNPNRESSGWLPVTQLIRFGLCDCWGGVELSLQGLLCHCMDQEKQIASVLRHTH